MGSDNFQELAKKSKEGDEKAKQELSKEEYNEFCYFFEEALVRWG